MAESMPSFDLESHAGPLPSPCTGVCTMDAQTALCRGCLRTIDEIIDWAAATEARKRMIWTEIQKRRAAQ